MFMFAFRSRLNHGRAQAWVLATPEMLYSYLGIDITNKILSKVSVKDVFMHYFPNMSPAYGRRWRTSYPKPANLPTDGKKSCGRP